MRTENTDSVTTEDVLNALGRYAREANISDRQTAAQLGVSRLTLQAWLRGAAPPQRCLLARLAGFLRVHVLLTHGQRRSALGQYFELRREPANELA